MMFYTTMLNRTVSNVEFKTYHSKFQFTSINYEIKGYNILILIVFKLFYYSMRKNGTDFLIIIKSGF